MLFEQKRGGGALSPSPLPTRPFPGDPTLLILGNFTVSQGHVYDMVFVPCQCVEHYSLVTLRKIPMHACRVWINSTSLWQKSSYVNIYNSLSEKEIESSLIVISVYIQNTQYSNLFCDDCELNWQFVLLQQGIGKLFKKKITLVFWKIVQSFDKGFTRGS